MNFKGGCFGRQGKVCRLLHPGCHRNVEIWDKGRLWELEDWDVGLIFAIRVYQAKSNSVKGSLTSKIQEYLEENSTEKKEWKKTEIGTRWCCNETELD